MVRLELAVRGGFILSAAVAVGAAGCGRSERIGWADREMPESVAVAAAADTEASTPGPGSDEALYREYQALAASLAQVQMEAMADSQLAATWNELTTEVEAKILNNSEFHRGLVARRREIEALMAAETAEEKLTDTEKAELARHYRNIQVELARARNQELLSPEFVGRLSAFQKKLFERMRQLQPNRSADINRMQQLESLLRMPSQDEPPVPGMRPFSPPGPGNPPQ